jgi:hypothetical protein
MDQLAQVVLQEQLDLQGQVVLQAQREVQVHLVLQVPLVQLDLLVRLALRE